MKTTPVFAYGMLGLPLAFAALPMYVHIPRYYAEVAGIPLALLGLILLGARFIDAGIDPWLGWLADRWPRRNMIALALVPFGVGFVALLTPPTMHTEAWLIGALLLTSSGFSAATIAYQALGADCGSSSQQRTQLTAAREGFSLLGVVLAAALPSLIAIDLNMGIARLAWIFPALLIVAAAVTLFGTNKFAGTEAHRVITTPRHEPLLHSVRKVFADAVFRRLLAVFLINGIAAALPSTLFLFFVADVLQVERASGALLALYFIAGAMSLPLWVRLAARYGRVAAWFASMLLSIIAFAGTALLSSGDLGFFVVICLASGLALGADLTLPAAIAADLGERHGLVGAYFGVWNFVAKLNLALAAGLALPLLGALGYIPGGSAELTALVFAYALLPLIFKTLAGALLWRWRQSLEVDL